MTNDILMKKDNNFIKKQKKYETYETLLKIIEFRYSIIKLDGDTRKS